MGQVLAARTGGAAGVIRVCFHGAESTGKSTLAVQLAGEFALPWVPEYGREWAETRGTDFSLDTLLEIARGQDAGMRAAAAASPPVLLLDTDPLMTAASAAMLFGHVPDELLRHDRGRRLLPRPTPPGRGRTATSERQRNLRAVRTLSGRDTDPRRWGRRKFGGGCRRRGGGTGDYVEDFVRLTCSSS